MVRELAQVIDVKHGFAFEGRYFSDEPPGDILLTPGNFLVGGGFKDHNAKYYNGAVPADFILSPHDLLLTMTDLSKAADTLGFPAMVPVPPSGRHYLHNQRIGKVVITDPRAANAMFLYRVFCSDSYRHEILASASGTTVKHTSPSRIKAYRTVFPPPKVLEMFEAITKPWRLRAVQNRCESLTLAGIRDALLPKLLSGELSVGAAKEAAA
jgi:type I restriction enzyme S subunit